MSLAQLHKLPCCINSHKSGVGFTIRESGGQLQLLPEMSSVDSGHTAGLMGNSNGIKGDDVLGRGSTKPIDPATVTEEDIFHFGNSCESPFKTCNPAHWLSEVGKL